MGTSLLIFRTNQWTGFYIIGTSVIKELKLTRYWKIKFVGMSETAIERFSSKKVYFKTRQNLD